MEKNWKILPLPSPTVSYHLLPSVPYRLTSNATITADVTLIAP